MTKIVFIILKAKSLCWSLPNQKNGLRDWRFLTTFLVMEAVKIKKSRREVERLLIWAWLGPNKNNEGSGEEFMEEFTIRA